MRNWFSRDRDAESTDELGRDMMLAEALESLDPAGYDPNYWFRFHGRVMVGAGTELARRRMMANLTVAEVLVSWSRTVVPTAVLAAAVAALMLVREGPGSFERPVGVEELLVTDIPAEAVPAMLSVDAPVAFVTFASEIF